MANTYLSINMDAAGGTDVKDVKVSLNDITSAFLEDKVVPASAKITINKVNPGGNES